MSKAPTERAAPRLKSGTPYLDTVLEGGFLRGSMCLIGGPPGSGKTTLANEICYRAARNGERCLYVTFQTETHDRMLLHLRSFEFFDPALVGTSVHYVSGVPAAREDGRKGLLDMLERTCAHCDASIVVLDGLAVLKEQAASDSAFRETLQGVSVRMAARNCTVFLLGTELSKSGSVEAAVADAVIALSAELLGLKATRGIEIVKLRGSNNVPGRHTFLIDSKGFRVFPRFEAVQTDTSKKLADPQRRSKWGIAGLDEMCAGGLVTLSCTLVMGSPGSGKTLVGLSFLTEGAQQGEPGLYFGFAESGDQLALKCSHVGLKVKDWCARGMLRLESRAPVETLPDAMAQDVITIVKRDGIKRLVLDGLEPFAKEAIDPERTTRFLAALINALRELEVTTLVIMQTNAMFGPKLHSPISGVEAICDNLVLLRFFEMHGELHRLIAVLKMRDSGNDPFLRKLKISDKGLAVGEAYVSFEGTLTGQPHSDRDAPPNKSNRPIDRGTKGSQ